MSEPINSLPVHLPPSADPKEFFFRADSFPPLHLFATSSDFAALDIPVQRTAELRKKLSKLVLRLPRTKNVYPASESNRRLLVLSSLHVIQHDDDVKQLLEEDCRASTMTIETTYENLTAEQVLRRLLPVEEVPVSFEAVGHIAHVNLRDELRPYRYWIGKVLLDKNQPSIRTVVDKVGTIATEYRTFGMEVIAGKDEDGWSQVTVREEGSSFALDFQQVYWNSRLAGEHRRLVAMILKQARDRDIVVADLMAGVGPFAVPLTSKKARVTCYANDLNPASFKYLELNARANKCQRLHCFNLDARAFVQHLQAEKIVVDEIIMNLPQTAPEFLDAFDGYQSPVQPRFHVHCFAPKSEEGDGYPSAIARCETALGAALFNATVRTVRNVAPNKNMVCVEFVLPASRKRLREDQD